MVSLPGKRFREKDFRQRLIISVAAMSIILALTFIVITNVSKNEEEHAFSDIKNAAQASDLRMVSLVEDSFRSLSDIVDFQIMQNPDQDTVDTFKAIAGIPLGPLGMEVRVYLPDGRAYSASKGIEDVSAFVDYEAVLSSMENGRYISRTKFDYIHTDCQVIEFFTPVIKNGENVALLSAVMDLKKLSAYMAPSSFNGQANVLFLDDADGVFFLDTFHNTIENAAIYANRTDKSGKSIIPFLETMISRQETYTTIASQTTGKTLYIYAVPSGIEGWTSAIIIEEDIAFGEKIRAGQTMKLLAAAEVLICLIYIVWMFRLSKKQALAGSRDLLNRMAGEDGLFLIDCVNDTRKTIHNHTAGADNYTDDESYSDSIKKYVDNCVAESDRAMMREATSRTYMLERLKTAREYTVEYRDISTSIQRFYSMRIVKYSDSEVLQSFAEKDREIFDRLIFKKLEAEYFALFAIDLEAGLLQVLKKGPWKMAGEVGSVEPYTMTINKLADTFDGDARAFFHKISDISFLRLRFATEDKGSAVYRTHMENLSKWGNITVLVLARRKNGTPSLLAMCFSLLDSDANEKADLQYRLETSMKAVGGLASEYSELYHVDLDSGKYTPYYVREKSDDIRTLFEQAPKFESLVAAFTESGLVHPDDRKRLREFYSSDMDVRRALRRKKKMSMLLKRKYGDEYLWTEVSIIKCEAAEEEAHSVIVGIIEKDADVRRELEALGQKQEAEESRKLVENVTSLYNIVYVVNMEDDSLSIRRMDADMLEKQGNFSNFTEAREFTLTRVIHPRDRERMRNELAFDTIRRKLEDTPSYALEYCIIKNGVTMWGEMNITSIGGNKIIIGMAEKDIEIAKRRIEEKRYGEYLALYFIDLDTERIREIRNTSAYQTGKVDECDYGTKMRAYAETLTGEAKEFFMHFSDPAFVRKELAADNKRTFMFKPHENEDKIEAISYVIERHEDGTPAVISLGFSRVDALKAKKQEQREE